MKKTIKKICQMEGKKVQVSRGNVMEVLRCLNEILSDDIVKSRSRRVHLNEFLKYLQKSVNKKSGNKK